jgi:hypothetical protein
MGPGVPTGTGIPGTLIARARLPRQDVLLLRLPLSDGRAGLFTGTFSVLGVLHHVSVDFFAWTPGSLMFSGLTTLGVALPDVTVAGSSDLSPKGGRSCRRRK